MSARLSCECSYAYIWCVNVGCRAWIYLWAAGDIRASIRIMSKPLMADHNTGGPYMGMVYSPYTRHSIRRCARVHVVKHCWAKENLQLSTTVEMVIYIGQAAS